MARRAATNINIIKPGQDHGWGVITMGRRALDHQAAEEGMDQPVVYYTPTIAPSGITFHSGTKYPGWKNNCRDLVRRAAAAAPRNQRRAGQEPRQALFTSLAAFVMSSPGPMATWQRNHAAARTESVIVEHPASWRD